MGKGKPKHQPAPAAPRLKEPPRTLPGFPGAADSGDRLCWRFTHADNDGPWGVAGLKPPEMAALLGHLAKFEKMTVNAAFHNGGYPGKDYDVDAIPAAEAIARLEALGLGDQTKIWALRCGGKPRLWGFLAGHVFHVVFWDPEHEVWPSNLKHT